MHAKRSAAYGDHTSSEHTGIERVERVLYCDIHCPYDRSINVLNHTTCSVRTFVIQHQGWGRVQLNLTLAVPGSPTEGRAREEGEGGGAPTANRSGLSECGEAKRHSGRYGSCGSTANWNGRQFCVCACAEAGRDVA